MVNANTDTDFDEDDALEAVYTIHDQVSEAKRAYEDGPSPAQLAEKVSKVEQEAQEIARFADSISDLCGDINGSYDGLHALVDSGEEVWDALEIINDRVGVIEAALDADDGDTVTGTLDLDGRQFNVELTPVAAELDIPHPDSFDYFGGWLDQLLTETDGLDEEWLSNEPLVSEDRVSKIIHGETPRGDEGPSILKSLVDCGHITEEAANTVSDVHLGGVWSYGNDDTDADDEDEPEGLGDLFG